MNVQSCENCGVVYDYSRMPEFYRYDDEGNLNSNEYAWDEYKKEYMPTVDCPNCGVLIFKESGEVV
ncbi:MAG: hypothetical protein DRO67_00230 [Candidatus Asgardarchaeum californiense]|nr:MAG: hypothetical protein DRO67_00230 [Candidatus Asgardarchaeum californiense]